MSSFATRPAHPVVEWTGAVSSLVGSLILAQNSSMAGWGFVLFLLSNLLLIYSSVLRRAAPHLCMYLGFTGTSLYGVFNWLFS